MSIIINNNKVRPKGYKKVIDAKGNIVYGLFTYTQSTIEHVATQTCYKLTSGTWSPISDGDQIKYGDFLYWTATASEGYNNPTITYNSPSNALKVTNNVKSSDYITAGSIIRLTIALNTSSTHSSLGAGYWNDSTSFMVDYGTVVDITDEENRIKLTLGSITRYYYPGNAEPHYTRESIILSNPLNISRIKEDTIFTGVNYYTPIQYTVTGTCQNGTVTISSGTHVYGSTISYTQTPDEHYWLTIGQQFYTHTRPYTGSIVLNSTYFTFDDTLQTATRTFTACTAISYWSEISASNSVNYLGTSSNPSTTGIYLTYGSRNIYIKQIPDAHYEVYYNSIRYYNGDPYYKTVNYTAFTFNDELATATYTLSNCNAINYTVYVKNLNLSTTQLAETQSGTYSNTLSKTYAQLYTNNPTLYWRAIPKLGYVLMYWAGSSRKYGHINTDGTYFQDDNISGGANYYTIIGHSFTFDDEESEASAWLPSKDDSVDDRIYPISLSITSASAVSTGNATGVGLSSSATIGNVIENLTWSNIINNNYTIHTAIRPKKYYYAHSTSYHYDKIYYSDVNVLDYADSAFMYIEFDPSNIKSSEIIPNTYTISGTSTNGSVVWKDIIGTIVTTGTYGQLYTPIITPHAGYYYGGTTPTATTLNEYNFTIGYQPGTTASKSFTACSPNSVTFSKGTGIDAAYSSPSSTATYGNASGTRYEVGSTVYMFATVNVAYNVPSGWTLISGSTYRIGSQVVSTGWEVGTINAGSRKSFTVTWNGPNYGGWSDTYGSGFNTVYYGDEIIAAGTTVTCYQWDNPEVGIRWERDAYASTDTAQYTYSTPSVTSSVSSESYVTSNVTITATNTRTLRSYTITMPTTSYGTWTSSSGTAYYGDYMYRDGNTWTCKAGGSSGSARWSTTLNAKSPTSEYTYTASASGDSFTVTGAATAGSATSSRTTRTYTITFSDGNNCTWNTHFITGAPYGSEIYKSGNTVYIEHTILGWIGDSTASKPSSTVAYDYTDPSISGIPSGGTVTSDLTITASSSATDRTYYTYWNRTSGSASACLPSGYTGLEYIQSTGTQYIDTGVNVNLNTYSFEVDSQSTDTSQNGMVFGEWLNTSTYYWWLYYYSGGGAITLYATNSSGGQHAISTGLSSSNTNRNVFKWTGKKMYVNGSLTADFSTITFSSSQTTARICDANVGSGVSSWPFKGKVYGCKIWNANGELVRNLIPAKNSSNVVGLYDIVNGTFYTNAGSGSFTAGPTITYGGYSNTNYTYVQALSYTGTTPTKSKGEYQYTFSGWESGNGQAVTSGTTTLSSINYGSASTKYRYFYPKFTATIAQYALTFNMDSTSTSQYYIKYNGASSFSGPYTSSQTVNVNYNSTYYWYAIGATGYSNRGSASSPNSGTMPKYDYSVSMTCSRAYYTYTESTITGVASQTCYRHLWNSTSLGYDTITSGTRIYYGDTLYWSITASTGYTVSCAYKSSSNPLTVYGNISSSSYISASLKSYTLTCNGLTNSGYLSSWGVTNNTSSSRSLTNPSNGSSTTVKHFDSLTAYANAISPTYGSWTVGLYDPYECSKTYNSVTLYNDNSSTVSVYYNTSNTTTGATYWGTTTGNPTITGLSASTTYYFWFYSASGKYRTKYTYSGSGSVSSTSVTGNTTCSFTGSVSTSTETAASYSSSCSVTTSAATKQTTYTETITMSKSARKTVTIAAKGTVISLDSVWCDPDIPSITSSTFSGSTITIGLRTFTQAWQGGYLYVTYTYRP